MILSLPGRSTGQTPRPSLIVVYTLILTHVMIGLLGNIIIEQDSCLMYSLSYKMIGWDQPSTGMKPSPAITSPTPMSPEGQ